MDRPILWFRGAGSDRETQPLGSVVGMFSATGTYEGGYSYSPYGEARATATAAAVTTNTQRYIGGYQETTNLYKLGARYYDATTGRFTQFDPAGQESNPYAYAACNPISNSDPSGLSCSQAILDAVLSSVGFAVAVGALIGLGAIAIALNPLGAVVASAIINSIGIGAVVGLGISIIGAGESVNSLRRECK